MRVSLRWCALIILVSTGCMTSRDQAVYFGRFCALGDSDSCAEEAYWLWKSTESQEEANKYLIDLGLLCHQNVLAACKKGTMAAGDGFADIFEKADASLQLRLAEEKLRKERRVALVQKFDIKLIECKNSESSAPCLVGLNEAAVEDEAEYVAKFAKFGCIKGAQHACSILIESEQKRTRLQQAEIANQNFELQKTQERETQRRHKEDQNAAAALQLSNQIQRALKQPSVTNCKTTAQGELNCTTSP